uniref:Uncharacterized protein n=1 Tax=Arundo donax TaxID=35708 RepID=A0A0A9C4C5_ARUDO
MLARSPVDMKLVPPLWKL